MSECTCGVKDYDECENCRMCRYHECECTKADREVYELRQEVDDLKQRIDVLEKMSCKCPTCAVMEKGEFI